MIVFFAQDAETTGSGLSSIYLFLLLGVAFYFLLIRPQRRRAAKQRELIESISVGDEIRTVGGMRGTIESLGDDTALLRLAEGSVEIERRAIASRIEQSTSEE